MHVGEANESALTGAPQGDEPAEVNARGSFMEAMEVILTAMEKDANRLAASLVRTNAAL
jgi:hypothetical protein